MNEFGIFYFEVGWIIMTIGAFLIGLTVSNKIALGVFIFVIALIGMFAYYCKHYIGV